MERQIKTVILEKGGIEIPKEITDMLGASLQCVCESDVWLIITNASDNRFTGEPLPSEGTTYFLPDKQMAALEMSPGNAVKLVFSDVLNTIILFKLNNANE